MLAQCPDKNSIQDSAVRLSIMPEQLECLIATRDRSLWKLNASQKLLDGSTPIAKAVFAYLDTPEGCKISFGPGDRHVRMELRTEGEAELVQIHAPVPHGLTLDQFAGGRRSVAVYAVFDIAAKPAAPSTPSAPISSPPVTQLAAVPHLLSRWRIGDRVTFNPTTIERDEDGEPKESPLDVGSLEGYRGMDLIVHSFLGVGLFVTCEKPDGYLTTWLETGHLKPRSGGETGWS